MLIYIARILFKSFLTLFAIVTLVFFATRLSGDAIDYIVTDGLTKESRDLLIEYYGLNEPLGVQYLRFLGAFADGQFGLSFIERRPVIEIVAERIWPSLQLLIAGMALTIVLALPMGILAALHRKSWIGSGIMSFAFFGYAVPDFIFSVFMVLVFSYALNWLPVVGNGTIWHFIMPVLAFSGSLIASLTRFTRNAMLDVLSQDYMRTARAKGLREGTVILKHGFRNAWITVLSVIGLQIATRAAASSVVVETIFAWPGMGQLLVNSAIQRDYPVLQFGVVTVACAVIIINAVVDIAYAYADPRIRLREA
ncbi:MAG: ABC transporter permease [Pikeienuella sp.]